MNGFAHCYSGENLDRIDKTLKKIHHNSDGKKYLDVGFGNPIVLERALNVFSQCNGLYVTLERVLDKGIPRSILTEGNCYQIPFDSHEFDLVSGYALLHIIPSVREFYQEVFRVLKKGGYLYTDGDRSIHITKLLRMIKMTQYRLTGNKHKFKYWRDILNTKDNFHQEGIDCYELKKILKEIGFRKVVVIPWFSSNPELDGKIIYRVLKRIITTLNLVPLHTHIQILAMK